MNPVSELPHTPNLSDRYPTPFLTFRAFKAVFSPSILLASMLGAVICWALNIPDPASALHWAGHCICGFFAAQGFSLSPEVIELWTWPRLIGLYDEASVASVHFDVLKSALSACGLYTPEAYCAIRVVLGVFIWTFIGLAIQRIAVVRLAAGDSRSLYRGLKWAQKKYLAFWGSVFLLAFTTFLIWLVPWSGLNIPFLFFWLFPVWYLFVLVGIIVAVGSILSLPLLGASLVAEDGDAFDAASRAFSYALQKPVSLVCCLFWTLFWGTLGIWLLSAFFKVGMLASRDLFFLFEESATENVFPVAIWMSIIDFIPEILINAYLYTASAGIYLILRFRVDSVELDEVAVETPYGLPHYQLPEIMRTDASEASDGSSGSKNREDEAPGN